MPPRTAWTKKASSVPSDRIRSPHVQQPSKPKQKAAPSKDPPLPKSKAVAKLELVLEGLLQGTGKSKGGCFCLGKNHALSPYTPICMNCGLILCALQRPELPCPHCQKLLLDDNGKLSLADRLRGQIADTLAKEQQQRDREAFERAQAAGAFPSLPGASTPPRSVPTPPPASATRKVLSLNSSTKKVVLSSFTSVTRTPTPTSSAAQTPDEEETRVPPPPTQPDYVQLKEGQTARPWEDLRGGGATYIPLKLQSIPIDRKKPQKGGRKAGNKKPRDGEGSAGPS